MAKLVGSTSPRIVHGKHRSYPIWAVIAATSVLVLLIAVGVLDYLQARALSRQDAALEELQRLNELNQTLRTEKGGLLEQITLLQRAQKIDKQALSSLQEKSAKHQSQVAGLQRKLAFYESIVDPNDKTPGLRVHRLHLRQGKEANEYHLELILSQVSRAYKVVNGDVSVQLVGSVAGKSKTTSLRELTKQKHALKFRFKYFQDFQKMLRLPKGFEPERVVIKVRLLNKAGKRIGKLEKRYSWKQALASVGWGS